MFSSFVDAITLKLSNFILQGAKAHMTDLEFLEKEIAAWKCSPRRMMQIKGFLYYDGDHDVIHRKRTMIGEGGELEVVENLPNNRIVDNQYAKMVNQKANYLFGKPFTLSGENTAYIELLKKIFDKKFMRTLKSAGKAAYNGGIRNGKRHLSMVISQACKQSTVMIQSKKKNQVKHFNRFRKRVKRTRLNTYLFRNFHSRCHLMKSLKGLRVEI